MSTETLTRPVKQHPTIVDVRVLKKRLGPADDTLLQRWERIAKEHRA